MTKQIIPKDSRYTPFTQQPYCCVPTSIQIIMYKLGVPLVPQEKVGYHLGLTVPPKDKDIFWHVRVSDKPPAASGYGTQIQKPRFNPNNAFKKLNLPLKFTYNLIDEFNSIDEARRYLKLAEKENRDVVVCFKYGELYDTDQTYGHASVFDRYLPKTDEVRLVDPIPHVPKWRVVPLQKLFESMRDHGPNNAGGFWEIERLP